MSNYSLATFLQFISCQPHTLITGNHEVRKKSMFYELGQLGSRVKGHSRTSGEVPKNCLVLLTMNWELSGGLMSTLVFMSPFWAVLI